MKYDKAQTALSEYGFEIPDKYEFDCPFCGKHFNLKQDRKGNVYHRPWVFHLAGGTGGDHGNLLIEKYQDLINVLMWYYTYFDEEAGQEMRDIIKGRGI